MLAAMHGNRADDDERVRVLLDQRTQRADVPPPHTRLSIFSDRSDSPSLYSHFDNNYRTTPTTPVPQFPRFHDSNVYDDQHTHYAPLSPKELLADPNASSLDLSEDTCSESGSRIADPDDGESNLNPDSDEDPETRLSLMGPRMRVHSRAPWEEDEGNLSDSDVDDGGNDNVSVFGSKKSGRAVIRGLAFGSKSPAPRPSFDSSCPPNGKRSFETTSSIAVSTTSRSAIHALAQASMSSTSLAIGPSPSSNRLPHKLSVGRLALNRDRSGSGIAAPSDTKSTSSLQSPHSATYSEYSGRDSPISYGRGSARRSDLSASVARTGSPSPIPQSNRDGVYMHPYANPALLDRSLTTGPYGKDGHQGDSGHANVARNDSTLTLSASEETVMLTQSSSAASASVTSNSGLEDTTPPTSDFSLVTTASRAELTKPDEFWYDGEKTKQQKRARRETKLGPISAPTMVTSNDFVASTPYNLISLEQAQARVKERNRSATTGALPFPMGASEDGEHTKEPSARARSCSVASKSKHPLPLITVDSNNVHANELHSPASASGSRQPSPVGLPGGKVLRPKRSGFMKLFNGRDKDRDIPPPPIPPLADIHTLPPTPEHFYPPATPRLSKAPLHRVPVPAISISPKVGESKDDSRLKKPGPSLSIKVSSPPTQHSYSQNMGPRRSDSPKLSSKAMSPKIPSSAPAGVTQFPPLKLRPVSGFFSNNFAEHLLSDVHSPRSARTADTLSLISPTTVASSDLIPSPVNANFDIGNCLDAANGFGVDTEDGDQSAIIAALKEQIRTSRKAWQRQIWELEGQVRDLRAEIDDLKNGDICEACGRGIPKMERKDCNAGVVHRPRAKTGHGARFASGNEA